MIALSIKVFGWDFVLERARGFHIGKVRKYAHLDMSVELGYFTLYASKVTGRKTPTERNLSDAVITAPEVRASNKGCT